MLALHQQWIYTFGNQFSNDIFDILNYIFFLFFFFFNAEMMLSCTCAKDLIVIACNFTKL